MRVLLGIFSFLLIISCKEVKKETKTEKVESKEEPVIVYPEALQKVFTAHGGLKQWKGFKALTYDISKPKGNETHTIDLYSRKDRIDTQEYSLGFDGENVWKLDENETYKGDPIFYHNLMFYFYAMPFVLSDTGISYGEIDDLVFDGVAYPGIRISYGPDIGASPKDEYFIHYNPETFQMEWLGYTVTYRSGEKSDNVKWIRYGDWIDVNGLVLPKSITWHAYEGRTIKEVKSTVIFENIALSLERKPNEFFAKPVDAITISPKKEN